MTPLIGLMGLKQSGKDTLAARLVTEHGFTRYALADPMREFALALDPIVSVTGGSYARGATPPKTFRLSDWVKTYGWDRSKEENPEVRRTLQRLGTEAGREILGSNVWVNVTDALVTKTLPSPVVITDVRFPNEYAWIHSRGGINVRIIRPGVEASDPHPSEAMASDLDGYPAYCTGLNDGSVKDFHEWADLLALHVLKSY